MCNSTYRTTALKAGQNEKLIKKEILSILKKQKVSLSQARGIFEDIINCIEDSNPICL